MGYVIAEMFGCLVIAALIGLFFGWLLASWRQRERAAQSLKRHTQGLSDRLAEMESGTAITSANTERIGRLESKTSDLDNNIPGLRKAVENGAERGSKMEDELGKSTEALEVLHGGFAKQQEEILSMSQALRQGESQLKTLQAESAEHSRTNETLKASLDSTSDKLTTAENNLKQLIMKLTGWETSLQRVAAQDQEIQSIKQQLDSHMADAASKLLELKEMTASVAKEQDSQIAEMRDRIVAHGKRPHPDPVQQRSPRELPKDDLKKIRGIGPVLERRLNEMGIVSFEQIASWGESDIDRVQVALDTIPDRIRREQWVAGARAQSSRADEQQAAVSFPLDGERVGVG
jgi:predicted flap endonuclease-1-like 5' DNA nuclease